MENKPNKQVANYAERATFKEKISLRKWEVPITWINSKVEKDFVGYA